MDASGLMFDKSDTGGLGPCGKSNPIQNFPNDSSNKSDGKSESSFWDLFFGTEIILTSGQSLARKLTFSRLDFIMVLVWSIWTQIKSRPVQKHTSNSAKDILVGLKWSESSICACGNGSQLEKTQSFCPKTSFSGFVFVAFCFIEKGMCMSSNYEVNIVTQNIDDFDLCLKSLSNEFCTK